MQRRESNEDGQVDDDSAEETTSMAPPKKPKQSGAATAAYSSVAMKLMQKMGHKEGKGLGRLGQGRADIIPASKQKGTRGLGYAIPGFENTDAEWQDEEVDTVEKVDWCPARTTNAAPDESTWIKEGPRILTIDSEDLFCTRLLLDQILSGKNVFDNLEGPEMKRAVERSNPFETIRGGFFMNRAAMKMANLDGTVGFMLTDPPASTFVEGEPLYFADVCAGPGGFSEYVLWRRGFPRAKGFGMTLRGACDFKLEDFFAGHAECFETIYGPDGDGDVYKEDNLLHFQDAVKKGTDDRGVHLFMADGGFSVEGQENIQEILSKRLYLCQLLCGICVLRQGGNLICNLFDLFTPFSVGLIYLMRSCFRRIAIHKPVTSRPANSERYIIGEYFEEAGAAAVRDYLFRVNRRLQRLGTGTSNPSSTDVLEIVPHEVMVADETFYSYIRRSNEQLGNTQVFYLRKVQAYAANTELTERDRQRWVREKCFQEWKVPDEMRKQPARLAANKYFDSVVPGDNEHFALLSAYPTLSESVLKEISVYDYRCAFVCVEPRVIVCQGHSNCFAYDTKRSAWVKIVEVKLDVPRDSLIVAEIMNEFVGEARGQRKIPVCGVFDAVRLAGEDIRHLHYTERLARLRDFCRVINKSSRVELCPLRVKDVFRLEELPNVLQSLAPRKIKGFGLPMLCFEMSDGRLLHPNGVLLLRQTRPPWSMAWSKQKKRKYWFNREKRVSQFETPKEGIADAAEAHSLSYWWRWSTDDGPKDALSVDEAQSIIAEKLAS